MIRLTPLLAALSSSLTPALPLSAQNIHEIAKQGYLEQAKASLAKDPQLVHTKDEHGRTPLHWACSEAHMAVMEYLIAKGANVNSRDNHLIAPLHIAAVTNQLIVADILITHGANTDIKDAEDRTPLHSACRSGHYDMVALLLTKGAHINAQDHNGFTPLHYAGYAGYATIAKTLVDNGAHVEAMTVRNRTPLIVTARESGNTDILTCLLKSGANINALDKNDDTALTLSAWRGFGDAVNLLLKNGAKLPQKQGKIQALMIAAVEARLHRLFHHLLNHDVDIYIQNYHKGTLLHSAAIGGSTGIVKFFLDKGFDINATDRNGWTALHYGAEKGRKEAIELLINHGANIKARTTMGQTAFNIAEHHGYSEAVAILVNNGAYRGPPQFPIITGEYFGQKAPGMEPEVFAPGIVSAHYSLHSSIIFSPDGKEAFWTVMLPARDAGYGSATILTSRVVRNRWTYPRLAPFDQGYRNDVPYFHPNGNKLFFISRRPLGQGAQGGKENIWYVERIDGQWGAPQPIGQAVNSRQMHWQFSVDRHGNVFYSSDRGIYYSRFTDGNYQEPESIAEAFDNATIKGTSPYISPDGDYLVFAAESGTESDSDLYVSFKRAGGSWTDAVPLGETINSKNDELCPVVTPDGDYLFFLRSGENYRKENYWVDARVLARCRPGR